MRATARIALLCLSPLMLSPLMAGAAAEDFSAGSLTIGQPWSRATPNGARSRAAT